MSEKGENPFNPRTVLALVLLGTTLFVTLLYILGSGMDSGSTNNGGSHAGGRGLNGYAALADLLERRGYTVSLARSKARLDDPGLLVLTPPLYGDADKLSEVIAARRRIGPTLLVLPKWETMPANAATGQPKARKGWVAIGDGKVPGWGNALKDVGSLDLKIDSLRGESARWHGLRREGTLAAPQAAQTMTSGSMVALVRDGNGQMLAGYLDDSGIYPELDADAGVSASTANNEDLQPLVIVAEPDLLNNYGLADRDRAMLALALVGSAMEHKHLPVSFDLTLNGLARSANLLTLAFTPPFLAATLCLLIAALVVGWRGFLRFGPPLSGVRAIAFGKRALLANAAGLIRRTRRLHLVAAPYADHSRERLARALALPRIADAAATEAAIDRALAGRTGVPAAFSTAAARLRVARRAADIVKAAQVLHSLERILKT
ncbi:MAG: DUF4350 domain-containing protein [Novosphingobium sp.]